MIKQFSTDEVQIRASRHLSRIHKELNDCQVTVDETTACIRHTLLGIILTIKESKTRYFGRSEGTGKLYVALGHYGNKQMFNERKDHTFRNQLVPALRTYIEREVALKGSRQQRSQIWHEADKILINHGLATGAFNKCGFVDFAYWDVEDMGRKVPGFKVSLKLPCSDLERFLDVMRQNNWLD